MVNADEERFAFMRFLEEIHNSNVPEDQQLAIWRAFKHWYDLDRELAEAKLKAKISGHEYEYSVIVYRCNAWSYPNHQSWEGAKLNLPDGRQCALDASHHGPHELVGPWTTGARGPKK